MSYVEKYGLLVLFVLCSLIIGVGVFGGASSAAKSERGTIGRQQDPAGALGDRLLTADPDGRAPDPALGGSEHGGGRLDTFDPGRPGPTTGRDRERHVSGGLRPVPSNNENLNGSDGLSPYRERTFDVDDNRTIVFPGTRGGQAVETQNRGSDAVAGFEIYTVGKHETLSQISQRKLGSFRRMPVILAANPGLDPDKVFEGQKIKIPLRGSVERESGKKFEPSAKPPSGKKASSKKASGKKASSKPKPVAKSARIHVVKHGDTLLGISKRYYRTVKHAGFLAKTNGMKLDDMLREGRKLRIPALPKNGSGK